MQEILQEQWRRHRFKTIGALAGLTFALLVVWLGLLWTLFIVFCTGVGYWIGKRLDEEPEGLAETIERLLRGGQGPRA